MSTGTLNGDGTVESAHDSPVKWRSKSELQVDVPPGAGADIGVAVVLRIGTVATGVFSFEPPMILALEPTFLVFGESRPLIACGTSFGTALPIERTLRYGGQLCQVIEDIDLDEANEVAISAGSQSITQRISASSSHLIPITSCIRCS